MSARKNKILNVGTHSLLQPLYYLSPRGQLAVMLLIALRELYVKDGRSTVTKGEAIRFIAHMKWFALENEDQEPYPSQRSVTGEPRWHTLIAWARKDSVLRDLVSDHDRNSWGLTRPGRDAIDREHNFCKNGARQIYRCFLWSYEFKRFMFPAYQSSSKELRRPIHFYRDLQCEKSLLEFQEEIARMIRLFD